MYLPLMILSRGIPRWKICSPAHTVLLAGSKICEALNSPKVTTYNLSSGHAATLRILKRAQVSIHAYAKVDYGVLRLSVAIYNGWCRGTHSQVTSLNEVTSLDRPMKEDANPRRIVVGSHTCSGGTRQSFPFGVGEWKCRCLQPVATYADLRGKVVLGSIHLCPPKRRR